ncbi:Uncharacterised protein [Candidatus Bilamarchaeum dharawalense]|uniref:Uncharacterized protein n=1 Tax=Candidatus Bilamarchaeum dharawalense TaxID=2885759 RepID=A0A5E4LSY6_9ARCH|nr:Uncharacterised protein [Candidatus Bilamarchaeum dharawalense]
MTDTLILAQLDKSWRSTCKVLLGEEIGDLNSFADYLKIYTDPIVKRKSILSGTDVTISSNRVPKTARVIGHNEMEAYAKKTASLPFNINDIKDIDSLVRATKEKVVYAGNIVLGNSSNILNSHRCVNTVYAIGCQDVYDGKYVAYTTSIRSPEYSFGCCFGGEIQFCIKVLDPHKQIRCLETYHCNVASDSYYSASLEDCTNCIFSFNQRNKHYLIGNVPLAKDKYASLKAKLVKEFADELKKKKKLPSVIQILSGKGDWNG